MSDCPFLYKLPIELRIRIYEEILPHQSRLKLRQHIPGTLNLSLLRLCRQTFSEALPVLYNSNKVVVTRNDFCAHTSPALKTPIKLEHIRHLHVIAFNRSIACEFSAEESMCDVCQTHAIGLIRTLVSVPRLKTAVIWIDRFQAFLKAFNEYLSTLEDPRLEVVVRPAAIPEYYLAGPAVVGREILLTSTMSSKSNAAAR